MISYARKLTLAILETLYAGSYYMASEIPIGTLLKNSTDDYYIDVPFSKNLLSIYRKNISKGTGAIPSFRYLYRLKIQPSLLNITNYSEIERAIQLGMVYSENIDDLLEFVRENGSIVGDIAPDKFFDKYIGYTSKDGELKILVNPADSKSINWFLGIVELVDGNAVRFDTGSNTNMEIPEFVISELDGYTRYYDAGISSKTSEWLERNFRKPYDRITLYRGVGISKEDAAHLVEWGEDITVEVMRKLLKEYLEIDDFTNIHKGGRVILHRGQESSWSTKPEISQTFAGASRGKELSILVKADVPASLVLVDLNLLPKETLKQFQHWTQNEVILKSADIPATISTIWVKPEFVEWLNENGYQYDKGKGIAKIS